MKNSQQKILHFFSKNPAATEATALTAGDEQIDKTLKNVFGLAQFRENQKDIIKHILSSQDALILQPTGFGKSLTFQLPAVISKGITLVVSPLLALIENQVNQLKSLNINAASINSSLKTSEKNIILNNLSSKNPSIKLLYVTPELLATEKFRKILKNLHNNSMLARLVIDEAHCISEWGHDFRSDYKKLGYLKDMFKLPVVALTATATKEVQDDIIKQLNLNRSTLKTFVSSFNRPNLHYEVRFKDPKTNNPYSDMLAFLQGIYTRRGKKIVKASLSNVRSNGVCGIIYCATRQGCEDVAKKLKNDNIHAESYHAGLSNKERKDILDSWTGTTGVEEGSDKKIIDIVVATISFGMGIDKKNVRFVIHWDLPKSIEAYYQESGRAGRDGNISRCILYYSRQDRDRITYLLSQKSSSKDDQKKPSHHFEHSINSFNEMIKYCENDTTCRHVFLVNYFSPSTTHDIKTLCPDKRCDFCSSPEKLKARKNKGLTQQLEKISSYYDPEPSDMKRLGDGTLVSYGAPKRNYNEMSMVDSDDEKEESFDGFQSASSMMFSDKAAKRLYLFGKKGPAPKLIKKVDVKKAVKTFSTTFTPEQTSKKPIHNLDLHTRHESFERLFNTLTQKYDLENDALPIWEQFSSRREALLEIAKKFENIAFEKSEVLQQYLSNITFKVQDIRKMDANKEFNEFV